MILYLVKEILTSYLLLFRSRNTTEEIVMLRLSGVPAKHVTIIAFMITICPGTVAFMYSSNKIYVHCLESASHSIEPLVQRYLGFVRLGRILSLHRHPRT